MAAIGLGACDPLVGNLVYLLGGASGIDPTPAIVGAGVVVVRLFVFDAGLAAFLPVARRDVIEQLDGAVLVADLDGAIVDANAAAVALAGGGPLAGRPLDDVLAGLARDPRRALGIPAAALPRLVDPFFTTKPPGEGTGLGLSPSFDLARDNQGVLQARNRDGGGAEFELWLPAAADEAPAGGEDAAVTLC